MEVFAIILSALGTVCLCVPPLLKGKKMTLILWLIFLANALIATSYVLTGAWGGATTCFLGAAQTIVNYFFERNDQPLPRRLIALYAASFIVANLVVFRHTTDLIALIAALAFVLAISQKNGKQYRLWALINAGLWILYDLCTLSFGPLSTHIIQTVTIVFGMRMHDRQTTND